MLVKEGDHTPEPAPRLAHMRGCLRPPIQLYYAENRMRDQKNILRRTARVWLLICNLGFEKEVRVRCLDMDGLYREYEAHFECFVSPQLELWSTANLPVAEPLHFMMSMRVGGRHYQDDNKGAGYRLYHQDEIFTKRN